MDKTIQLQMGITLLMLQESMVLYQSEACADNQIYRQVNQNLSSQ